MYRIILLMFLYLNCITSKVFELSEGKKNPIVVNRIDSIHFDKLNSINFRPTYKIAFNGFSINKNNLENCLSSITFFKCNKKSDLIKLDIKEINSFGGLHLFPSNEIFFSNKIQKLFKNQKIISDYQSPEIYATKDGLAFLSKGKYGEFTYCPEQENCNSYKLIDYKLKLEKYDLTKKYLVIVLDSESYVKKMYTFTLPEEYENLFNTRFLIVSSINESNKIYYYYFLTPFSAAADIVTSPVQLIYFIIEFMNSFGAYKALG